MPLHPSLLIWSLPVKNGKRILAFLYDRTFQQCPSIKGMGLVSEPRDLSPTAWLGGGGVFLFFFFILLDNVEVSGMVPSAPAILGITQCFRALSQ